METNESIGDRMIRLFVGFITLYLALSYNLWWLVIAIPLLLTSITGYCQIYKILGINTGEKPVTKIAKSKKKKL